MPDIGTTVLLAEDDLTLSDMYEERLKQEGFSVVRARDGEEAMEQIKNSQPSAVLLDIMMPKMNGLDVLKRLKEDPETKAIPVVIVTALMQEIERVKELMGPKDAYMVKSEVMPGDIIDHLKKLLTNP